ncbi:hypothetical protein B0H16DRAFT_1453659 [Mycena metata]|uniref:Uncharacterized protein n=1 Tax=Mycena metata TaxID=1033252 RepID=A0AAD7JLE7_9AGAR|nr:hypothetical protein B0H16DRAFT_1453659 [Mycena metata]
MFLAVGSIPYFAVSAQLQPPTPRKFEPVRPVLPAWLNSGHRTKNDPFAFSSIPALKSPALASPIFKYDLLDSGASILPPNCGSLSELATQTSRHTASDPSRPTASDLDQLAEDDGRQSVEFGHGCTALFRCSIASLGNDTQNLRMNPDPTSKCIVFHVRFRASPIPLAPIHRRVDSIGQGPANCNSLAIGTNTHRRPPIPWHICLYVRQWYPVPSDAFGIRLFFRLSAAFGLGIIQHPTDKAADNQRLGVQ